MGQIIYATEGVLHYLGFTQTDMMGKRLKYFVHSDDWNELRCILQRFNDSLLQSTNSARISFRLKTAMTAKGGRAVKLAPAYQPLQASLVRPGLTKPDLMHLNFDGSGISEGADEDICYLHCIPYSMSTICRSLFNMRPSMSSRHEIDLRFRSCDEKLAQVLDFCNWRHLTGLSYYDMVHPNDVQVVAVAIKEVYKKTNSRSGYYRLLTRSQFTVWVFTEFMLLKQNIRGAMQLSVQCSHFMVSEIQTDKCAFTKPTQINNPDSDPRKRINQILIAKSSRQNPHPNHPPPKLSFTQSRPSIIHYCLKRPPDSALATISKKHAGISRQKSGNGQNSSVIRQSKCRQKVGIPKNGQKVTGIELNFLMSRDAAAKEQIQKYSASVARISEMSNVQKSNGQSTKTDIQSPVSFKAPFIPADGNRIGIQALGTFKSNVIVSNIVSNAFKNRPLDNQKSIDQNRIDHEIIDIDDDTPGNGPSVTSCVQTNTQKSDLARSWKPPENSTLTLSQNSPNPPAPQSSVIRFCPKKIQAANELGKIQIAARDIPTPPAYSDNVMEFSVIQNQDLQKSRPSVLVNVGKSEHWKNGLNLNLGNSDSILTCHKIAERSLSTVSVDAGNSDEIRNSKRNSVDDIQYSEEIHNSKGNSVDDTQNSMEIRDTKDIQNSEEIQNSKGNSSDETVNSNESLSDDSFPKLTYPSTVHNIFAQQEVSITPPAIFHDEDTESVIEFGELEFLSEDEDAVEKTSNSDREYKLDSMDNQGDILAAITVEENKDDMDDFDNIGQDIQAYSEVIMAENAPETLSGSAADGQHVDTGTDFGHPKSTVIIDSARNRVSVITTTRKSMEFNSEEFNQKDINQLMVDAGTNFDCRNDMVEQKKTTVDAWTSVDDDLGSSSRLFDESISEQKSMINIGSINTHSACTERRKELIREKLISSSESNQSDISDGKMSTQKSTVSSTQMPEKKKQQMMKILGLQNRSLP